jgi:hypothetical protein
VKLTVAEWTARAAAHEQRIAPYADAFLERRSRGQKHPVHDFLFTYYSFSPTRLRQWVPDLDSTLDWQDSLAPLYPWLSGKHYLVDDLGLRLDPSQINAQVLRQSDFISRLCAAIQTRPPRLGCFGLHEWAMVYRQTPDQVRHNDYPLRMQPDELADFIDRQSINCTHYDAYRFFTPDAAPLNSHRPTLESRLELEQGGCLHANMDLYKWAQRLWPWVGSELIADSFMLALEGRDLDMRASPYDLADLGYPPLRIETDAGRRQYQTEQQALAERSAPLRIRLGEASEAVAKAAKQSIDA